MDPGIMAAKSCSSEIVEATEEYGMVLNTVGTAEKRRVLKPGQICSVEDDINQLFETIDIRNSSRNPGALKHENSLRKSAMKRPMRCGSSPAPVIGFSESVSLKQALRGLCISQASEMAAMRRLSKQAGSSRVSEAGTIKDLFKSVVFKATASGFPDHECDRALVENPLVPTASSVHGCNQFIKEELLNASGTTSVALVDIPEPNADRSKVPQVDHIVHFSVQDREKEKPTVSHTSSSKTLENLSQSEKIIPVLAKEQESEGKLHFASALSTDSSASNEVMKSSSASRHLFGPAFRNKNFFKRKIKHGLGTDQSSSSRCDSEVDTDFGSGTSKIISQGPQAGIKCDSNGKETSPSSMGNVGDLNAMDIGPNTVQSIADSISSNRNLISRSDDRSRSRERGDFSQSSKGSIGEYSVSTSISEESTLSGSSRSGYRPHMSKDLRWESIHHIEKHHGRLNLQHFKILKKIGGGDVGNVYLAELIGRNCLFGLKVMDNEFLASRKKMARAQTEKEILQMLDHPFLPTLFSYFTTDKYLCLVMEYCPGGDLHVLRQKQPSKHFSEQAARFYVSEVLLALEYLHMLGVVYRDLKPENILIREDGHIMLSDFDLSFRCAVDPILLLKSTPSTDSPKRESSPCTEPSCIHPLCLQPSWQVPCFTPKFISASARPSKLKADLAAKYGLLPQLVAEPTSARSNSFVGTHEYLAPEVIKGEGHGSAVDWWTLGIFLYELVYGRTPFKGSGNEDTLSNVMSQSLMFPSNPIVTSDTRDLIRGLLVKEPENRLGATEGAAEIKRHPFFKGLNWALIRCTVPPELPEISELGNGTAEFSLQEEESTCLEEKRSARGDMEFDMF